MSAPASTAADAKIPGDPPPGSKRPNPKGQNVPHKKARFTSKDKSSTTYQSISLPSSIVVQPIKRYFLIHTGSKNFVKFVQTVYQTIISRDHRMEKLFPSEVFQYVSLIGFYYRVINVGEKSGYHFNGNSINTLKRLAEALLLPDIICKAIECIGVTTLPNGMTVVPFVPTDKEVRDHEDYIHPTDIKLSGAAPENANAYYYDGCLRPDIVTGFIACSVRGIKSNILFRRIAFDNIEGRPEFSICIENLGTERRARATYQMEESLAHLGAAYGFRELENRDDWLGDDNSFLSYVHSSAPFDPTLFTVTKVANELPK